MVNSKASVIRLTLIYFLALILAFAFKWLLNNGYIPLFMSHLFTVTYPEWLTRYVAMASLIYVLTLLSGLRHMNKKDVISFLKKCWKPFHFLLWRNSGFHNGLFLLLSIGAVIFNNVWGLGESFKIIMWFAYACIVYFILCMIYRIIYSTYFGSWAE